MGILNVIVSKPDAHKVIIQLRGDFSGFHMLKAKLLKSIEGVTGGKVVLDISGISYLNSIGIANLVDFNKKVRSMQNEFEVQNATPQVVKILKLVKVDVVLGLQSESGSN